MKKITTIILMLATVITMFYTPVYAKSYELVAQKTVTLGENEIDALDIYCKRGEKVRFEVKQDTAMDYFPTGEYQNDFWRLGTPESYNNQKVILAYSLNDSNGKHWWDGRFNGMKKRTRKKLDNSVTITGRYTFAVRNVTEIPYGYKLINKPTFTIKVYKK